MAIRRGGGGSKGGFKSSTAVSIDDSDLTLSNSDFEENGDPKRQANVLLFGDAGTGKTSFVTMWAPPPIAFINFDRRAEWAIKKARESGRRILSMLVKYPGNVSRMSVEQAAKAGQAGVDSTLRNLEIAVRESERGHIRTICLDTGTEFSELLQLSITGQLERAAQGDYGKSKGMLNRQWLTMFMLAREGLAHFVVLARAKAIWEDNKPTGRFTFRGPEVMYDSADWAAQIRVQRAAGVGTMGKIRKPPGLTGQGGRGKEKKFEVEVIKAGNSIEELGAVYTSDDWGELGPFVYSCLLQYPESTPEDWT